MPESTATRDAIVGTAGHIDHGKTALIQRLTGINTDRLPEEQKRGISIELGFAFMDLGSGRRIGIVDVPGHERFVRQMLAGAGGMDLVLLVVAADEGVMPQTREHLEIVNLLQVPDGFVVLTKSDLVTDPEWFEIVEGDIATAVKGSPFDGKRILRCSAKTGEGIDAVRAHIEERLSAARFVTRGRETRLPVDRVFVLQGFGTVVAGTLWGGSLSVGDAVTLLPERIETRIKTVHVHDREVSSAFVGQRVAVSLHRVEKERVRRGDWLVRSDLLHPAHIMDARFRLLESAPAALQNRKRVRVHLGASETLARLVLLDRDELDPGDEAPVQIRFESPAVAESGDRFVVRSYSPMHTIGGGTVLAPQAGKRRRMEGDVASEFRKLEEGSPLDRLLDLLSAVGTKGEVPKSLRTTLGLADNAFATVLDEGRSSGRLVGEARLFHVSAMTTLVAALREELEKHHRAHPVLWGQGIGDLKSQLSRIAHPALFDLVRSRVVADGIVEEQREQLALAGRPHEIPPEALPHAERLESRLAADGFAPPMLEPLLRELALPQAQDLVARLVFEGRLVVVSPEFVYSSAQVDELAARLRRHFESKADLNVAEAKDLFDGVSRKHVVPLLEFCDRRGWTRRVGEGRVRGGGL
jgi:selenocysteine-specific elongation factor